MNFLLLLGSIYIDFFCLNNKFSPSQLLTLLFITHRRTVFFSLIVPTSFWNASMFSSWSDWSKLFLIIKTYLTYSNLMSHLPSIRCDELRVRYDDDSRRHDDKLSNIISLVIVVTSDFSKFHEFNSFSRKILTFLAMLCSQFSLFIKGAFKETSTTAKIQKYNANHDQYLFMHMHQKHISDQFE